MTVRFRSAEQPTIIGAVVTYVPGPAGLQILIDRLGPIHRVKSVSRGGAALSDDRIGVIVAAGAQPVPDACD